MTLIKSLYVRVYYVLNVLLNIIYYHQSKIVILTKFRLFVIIFNHEYFENKYWCLNIYTCVYFYKSNPQILKEIEY